MVGPPFIDPILVKGASDKGNYYLFYLKNAQKAIDSMILRHREVSEQKRESTLPQSF